MKRTTLILLVDSISFAGFVFLVSTGILLHYLLPPGSGRWSSIWGMNRHDWGDIHFIISTIFFCVLLLHLVLHWKSLRHFFSGRKGEASLYRALLGVVGLIAIILIAVSPLISPVDSSDRQDRGGWTKRHAG